jgi:hypothetical protein
MSRSTPGRYHSSLGQKQTKLAWCVQIIVLWPICRREPDFRFLRIRRCWALPAASSRQWAIPQPTCVCGLSPIAIQSGFRPLRLIPHSFSLARGLSF